MKKLIGIILLFALVSIAFADSIQPVISIQGRLMNISNATIQGTTSLTFKIYNVSSGGSALYTSTQSIVTSSDGVYTALLTNLNLPFDMPYYVGITAGTDAEMAPRINVTAVPFAFRANVSDYLNSNSTVFSQLSALQTSNSSAYSLISTLNSSKGDAANCPAGQVVQNITAHSLQCIATSGTGTVTQINTDISILGGPITTTGTLSLNKTDTDARYMLTNSSLNWSYLQNFPTACGAGNAITALLGIPTCTPFLTSETDPLWTGNLTLVPFLAQNENITGVWNFTAGYKMAGIATPPSPIAGNLIIFGQGTEGHVRPVYMDDDGTLITIGRDNFIIVNNTAGNTLNIGEVVHISGATTTIPNVIRSQANSNPQMPAACIMMQSTLNHAAGYCMKLGILPYDTHTFSAGDLLYVSASVGGGLTNAIPAYPNDVQFIGIAENSSVNGAIAVSVAPFVGGLMETDPFARANFANTSDQITRLVASNATAYGNFTALNSTLYGNLTAANSTLYGNLTAANSTLNGNLSNNWTYAIALNNNATNTQNNLSNNWTYIIALNNNQTNTQNNLSTNWTYIVAVNTNTTGFTTNLANNWTYLNTEDLNVSYIKGNLSNNWTNQSLIDGNLTNNWTNLQMVTSYAIALNTNDTNLGNNLSANWTYLVKLNTNVSYMNLTNQSGIAPNYWSILDSGLIINTSLQAVPSCSASNRGGLWSNISTYGDTLWWCARNSTGSYVNLLIANSS